jgi:hypothetical protein
VLDVVGAVIGLIYAAEILLKVDGLTVVELLIIDELVL